MLRATKPKPMYCAKYAVGNGKYIGVTPWVRNKDDLVDEVAKRGGIIRKLYKRSNQSLYVYTSEGWLPYDVEMATNEVVVGTDET